MMTTVAAPITYVPPHLCNQQSYSRVTAGAIPKAANFLTRDLFYTRSLPEFLPTDSVKLMHYCKIADAKNENRANCNKIYLFLKRTAQKPSP